MTTPVPTKTLLTRELAKARVAARVAEMVAETAAYEAAVARVRVARLEAECAAPA